MSLFISTAAVEDETGISPDAPRSETAMQARLEAHHVAILVDDRDIARVTVVAHPTIQIDVQRPVGGTRGAQELLGRPWLQLKRAFVRIVGGGTPRRAFSSMCAWRAARSRPTHSQQIRRSASNFSASRPWLVSTAKFSGRQHQAVLP
jgi:hypothetical protein